MFKSVPDARPPALGVDLPVKAIPRTPHGDAHLVEIDVSAKEPSKLTPAKAGVERSRPDRTVSIEPDYRLSGGVRRMVAPCWPGARAGPRASTRCGRGQRRQDDLTGVGLLQLDQVVDVV